MTSISLGVPWNKKNKTTGLHIGMTGQSHSWEIFMQNRYALGYELYTKEYNKVKSDLDAGHPIKIVLLRNDKDHKKRGEAYLVNLRQVGPTKKYYRYDLSLGVPIEIRPYKYLPNERLKFNGVRVISESSTKF